MTRTTPPRPLDITAHFPELSGYATTATRLHPRPGEPSSAESSVGGPLLWPSGEEWPVCTDADAHDVFQIQTPDTVRRSRRIYAAATARAAASGERYALTDAERAELASVEFTEPHDLVHQPIPLVPVAQLFRSDVPDFAGPEGTDLLQVLWCPLDHPSEGHNPKVRVFWRSLADITDPLMVAPTPPAVNESYLPTPCTVSPEQVREFPYGGLLPMQLDDRIRVWEKSLDGIAYQRDLSLAPGWKVGGFADWSLTDPQPVDCAECGSAMLLLFTADSTEWEGQGGSWRPVDEPGGAAANPVDVTIGRGYALHVFRCPVSFEHPPATVMQ
ncbi:MULTISPECIES: hypothetical protein [Actinoplanes]|uniref:hypothetical protein n=1 Tax=Actinoplanes TaxID=1865 RepID=UPI0005F2BCE3|nr:MULTISPECIES: hypothetical protein [Actinoplanes]GLY08106.1 hypothetical protein Acsp01_84850 [Actinoplanes sp. NBRC 101535]